jgi:hypothetical protein
VLSKAPQNEVNHQRIVATVKDGVQEICRSLDSGFHRNDEMVLGKPLISWAYSPKLTPMGFRWNDELGVSEARFCEQLLRMRLVVYKGKNNKAI